MVKEKRQRKRQTIKNYGLKWPSPFGLIVARTFPVYLNATSFFSPCDGAFLSGQISEKIKKQIFLL